MATGGEHVAASAAAGEETPGRKAAVGESEAPTDLLAPSGWTKKLNPTRGGKFEVVFVSPTGDEIKSKRQLTQYLKAHPGGPASSEFIWATGNTPRRSSRLSEKVKAIESPEDEKTPKRERTSSSKRGEKGKQYVAAETGDHGNAEEAKGTDVEMEEADIAQEEKKGAGIADKEMKEAEDAPEEKKESEDAPEEKKEAENAPEDEKDAEEAQEEKKEAENVQEEKEEGPGVDLAEKTEGGEGRTEGLKVPVPGDVAAPVSQEKGENKEAENVQEQKKEGPVVDAAEKTEEGEGKTEGLNLPVPGDISAPVSQNKGDAKPAESEVAPSQGEENENGQVPESAVPPPASSEGKKKEEADSNTNPVTPPPLEIKADAVAAEAAKDAENSADNAAHKDDQMNAVSEEPSTVNSDNNGQIQTGASAVKCT